MRSWLTGLGPLLATTRLLAPTLLLAACAGASGAGEEEETARLPDALHPFSQGYEVTPFDAYVIDGVSLFRVATTGRRPRSTVVGVEDASGALLERSALFTRAAENRPPEVLAVIATDTVLGRHGDRPLFPRGPHPEWLSAADAALITAPAAADNRVTFFLADDAQQSLSRFEIGLAGSSVQIRSAEQLRASTPFCVPQLDCGCWIGCVQLRRLDDDTVEVTSGPGQGETRQRGRVCTQSDPPICAAVCDADTEDATCTELRRLG